MILPLRAQQSELADRSKKQQLQLQLELNMQQNPRARVTHTRVVETMFPLATDGTRIT